MQSLGICCFWIFETLNLIGKLVLGSYITQIIKIKILKFCVCRFEKYINFLQKIYKGEEKIFTFSMHFQHFLNKDSKSNKKIFKITM